MRIWRIIRGNCIWRKKGKISFWMKGGRIVSISSINRVCKGKKLLRLREKSLGKMIKFSKRDCRRWKNGGRNIYNHITSKHLKSGTRQDGRE